MSSSGTSAAGNSDPTQIVTELSAFVDAAVREGIGMRDFERGLFDRLLAVGFRLTEEFLHRQGDGDCGDTWKSSGKTLHRSEKAASRQLRTIFGEHQFEAFVYRNGKHSHTATGARPVDERLGIGPERDSPLVQEFSVMFCCEHAFGVAAEIFEAIFGQKLSVDRFVRTAEQILAALISSADTGESAEAARPEPRHKRDMTKFAEVLPDLGEEPVSGTQLVMVWASRQVEDRQGYPIATGVIEGACRHLVKDRMERSGKKRTQIGARELLHLRCLRASGFWNEFNKQRSTPHHTEHQLCG